MLDANSFREIGSVVGKATYNGANEMESFIPANFVGGNSSHDWGDSNDCLQAGVKLKTALFVWGLMTLLYEGVTLMAEYLENKYIHLDHYGLVTYLRIGVY